MTAEQTGAGNGEDLSAEALIEHYYAQGVTDGLPVVPPSQASFEAMLAGGGLAAGDVVAVLAARHMSIMADKVALNAVMAGCRPEYMPVLLAAVRALCEPAFNGHGPITTTASTAPVILVNGPIGPKLGINAKDDLFGSSFRANASIGRALRLILMNVLNCRPGLLDRSQLGNPFKYAACFAENEEDSPWEPLHVERGFSPHESTVTLFAANSVIVTNNALSRTLEQMIYTIADALSFIGSQNILGHGDLMVVLGREITDRFGREGWSKQQVQQHLFDHAGRTMADLKRSGRVVGEMEPGDEERWSRVVTKPSDIMVVVGGGRVGSHAACLHGWGLHNPTSSVTVPITVP